MKTKILPLFAICFMCVALLSGCANVNYTFFQYANGKISEVFSVTLDPNILTEINCADFSQEIKTVANDWKTSKAEQLSKAGVSCSGAEVEEENGKYIISISIDYDSVKAYNDAWGSGGGSGDSKPKYERGWFQDKYIIYQGKTEFAGSLTTTMATSLTTWIEANYPTYDWQSKLKNISGAYTRVYPSNIAPYIDEGGVRLILPTRGYTYCIWSFDMENPDFEITMYKNVVTAHNKANWLVSGLVVTAICGVLLFFILRQRKRKAPQQVVEEFLQNNQQSAGENGTAEQNEDEQTMLFGLTGVDKEYLDENIDPNEKVDLITKQETPDTQTQVEAPKKVKAKPKQTEHNSNDEEK